MQRSQDGGTTDAATTVESRGGLSLGQYAEIAVALEGVPPSGLAAKLASMGVSETTYRAAEQQWYNAMTAEMALGDLTVTLRFAEARQEVRQHVHVDRPPPRKAGSLSFADLQAWMAGKDPPVVFDMRFDLDNSDPVLPGALPMNLETRRRLEELDRSTPIVFVCFSGRLSLAAAQHHANEGFERTFSVEGGVRRNGGGQSL